MFMLQDTDPDITSHQQDLQKDIVKCYQMQQHPLLSVMEQILVNIQLHKRINYLLIEKYLL